MRSVGSLVLAVFLVLSTAPDAAASEESLYTDSRALVIAVTTYDHWRPSLDLADHARKVAAALEKHGFSVRLLLDEAGAAYLKGEGFHACDGSSPGHSQTCAMVVRGGPTEGRLTAGTIAKEIRTFLFAGGKAPDAKSRFLVWYSGHGHTVPVVGDPAHRTAAGGSDPRLDGEGVLVGADAPRAPTAANEELGTFLDHVVPMRELATWARLSPAQHVLFVLEACFSGTVFDARNESRGKLSEQQFLARPSREFLTAGDEEEVQDSDAFVNAFVRAIDKSRENPAKKGPAGIVTTTEIGDYVSRQVSEGSSAGRMHVPRFGPILDPRFTDGTFMFEVTPGRSVRPAVTLEDREALARYSFREDPGLPSPLIVPMDLSDASMGTQGRSRCSEPDTASDVYVGVNEVTTEEWDACVRDQECPLPVFGGEPSAPVTGVSFGDVELYLRWLERRTGYSYRLPTATEWRSLAGDDGSQKQIVCRGCQRRDPERPMATRGVDRFNRKGVADSLGNVWEWTQSCEPGCSAPPVAREACAGKRLIAGGSWASRESLASTTALRLVPEDTRSAAVGFRVVRNLGARR